MCINEKYINLFTDFGFKKIFGDRENSELLKSLINDILGLEYNQKVKSIIFKNSELLPDILSDRKAIFNLYCEDESGKKFIVELQRVYEKHFQSRALYYTTFPIQEQASQGLVDFHLTPIYFIGLLNFEVDSFRESKEYLHHGKIINIKSKNIMYDQLNMIYIEIPKFKKEQKELSTHLEWWLFIFQNLHLMDHIPTKLKGDVLEQAFKRAEFIKLPKAEQDQYNKNLKVYRELVDSFDSAHSKGFKRGVKQGIEKGIEKGIKAGMEQGILDIAKLSLAKGLDINIISTITGLSKEKLEKLL